MDEVIRLLAYSGSQIDEVQQQQSANNSQGLVGYLSYSRTAISGKALRGKYYYVMTIG